MPRERLYIGALSARSGRGVHAIRWYEAQGLIPGVKRDNGGRRVYDERHVSWLDLIDRLRHTGMSIADLREYVALVKQGDSTLVRRQEILSAHRARVAEKVVDLQRAIKLIDDKLDFYGEWLATGRQPEPPTLT